MAIEFRVGYTEALGDMVYDVFERQPELIKPPFVLLPREQTKARLRDLHEWVVGAYYGNEPVAAMWGSNEEIQWVANAKYRKRWITKGLMIEFFKWFYSKYDVMKAKPKNQSVLRIIKRLGFVGNGEIFERVK